MRVDPVWAVNVNHIIFSYGGASLLLNIILIDIDYDYFYDNYLYS